MRLLIACVLLLLLGIVPASAQETQPETTGPMPTGRAWTVTNTALDVVRWGHVGAMGFWLRETDHRIVHNLPMAGMTVGLAYVAGRMAKGATEDLARGGCITKNGTYQCFNAHPKRAIATRLGMTRERVEPPILCRGAQGLWEWTRQEGE